MEDPPKKIQDIPKMPNLFPGQGLQDEQDIANAQSFQDLFSEYMAKIQKRKAFSMGAASAVVSLVTSPILNLGLTKQLSIPNSPNYKTYGDFKNISSQGSFQSKFQT